jgi:pilus assembly protein CpaC
MNRTKGRGRIVALASVAMAAALTLPPFANAGEAAPKGTTRVAAASPVPADAYVEPAQIGPALNLIMGKSTLLRLPAPIDRISVGDPRVADITLISSRELYLLGKQSGTTNVILWRKAGQTTIIDVSVALDVAQVEARIKSTFPQEKGIVVERAANSIILKGTVSSALVNQRVQEIAEAYVRDINRALILPTVHGGETQQGPAGGTNVSFQGAVTGGAVQQSNMIGGAQVLNMLQVAEPQQVMVEVKVAEISKNLLDKLGVEMNLKFSAGDIVYNIISRLFDPNAGAIIGGTHSNGSTLNIFAENNDGLVRILAEPNIVAISGKEGSFLAGGSIFIPVPQFGTGGGAVVTLEEKPFGIGLKFKPTVLDGGRINLEVFPEVSDVLPGGIQISTGNITNVLPAFTIRRAFTTVQLYDGQSLMIGGLLKSNLREQIKAFPVLGQVPVLGALFRSSEYQKDKTELVFFVTPRLARPSPPNYPLPTDKFQEPTPAEFFLGGRMEGDPPAAQPSAPAPQQQSSGQQPGGFEVK